MVGVLMCGAPCSARGCPGFTSVPYRWAGKPLPGKGEGRGPRHTKLSDSSAGQKAAFQNIAQNKGRKMCCLKELPTEQVEASLKH